MAMRRRYPKIEIELCKGCGRCVVACPKKVLALGKEFNRVGLRFVGYSGDGCVGCGACFYVCPEPEAIAIFESAGDSGPDATPNQNSKEDGAAEAPR